MTRLHGLYVYVFNLQCQKLKGFVLTIYFTACYIDYGLM